MDTELKDTIARLARVTTGAAAALMLGTMTTSLAGCNTVEGAGEDMEAAGDAISDEAEDAND